MNTFDIAKEIIDLTDKRLFAIENNILKETLRALLNQFGNIYYIDGNGEKIKIRCTHGKQERAVGKDKYENTLVLPYLTITENGISRSEEGQRYNQSLVHYTYWDAKELRAKRFLSLPSRPVTIAYSINIWAKYQADLDQIRYSVINAFNPSITVKTRYSNYTKAFFESESDIASYEAQDTTDRVLRKSVNIIVETFLPSPKFLYTNTGEIRELRAEFDIDGEIESSIVEFN